MKTYEDWQIKPWTTNFLVGRLIPTPPEFRRYGIFVGQWVDGWWEQFYRVLYSDD